MGDKIIFDPQWMRQRAADCETGKNAVKGLLKPADDTVGKLKKAANGWTFLGSLDQMMKRWEDLNKLLQDELNDSANKIKECAAHHGHGESLLEKVADKLNPFD